MKINGNYANNPVQKAERDAKGSSNESLQGLEKGQVIEGVIREVSDKITIDFSGREVKLSKDTIQNATKGSIRKFMIMEASEKSIVLKEIRSTGKESTNPILSTKVEIDRMIFLENTKTGEHSKEDSTEPEDITDKMTKDDYYAASKELMPIEEYNLERLERAIVRIKYQKSLKQDMAQEYKSKLTKRRDEQKEAGERASVSDTGIIGLIAEKLIEADLPVTEDNIKSMKRTLKMAESITTISSNAKAYLIGNELEPTINNLYKAEHSGSKKAAPISDEAWEQLKKPAKKVIESANCQVNDETLEEARWLLDNGLPLTKANFEYKQVLDSTSQNSYLEKIIDKAAAAAGSGLPPEDADVTMPSRQEITKLVHDWNTVSDKALIRAMKRAEGSEGVSLDSLMNEQTAINEEERISSQKSHKEKSVINEKYSEDKSTITNDEALIEENFNIKEITARRQLEEIRLKLTAESGIRLSMKGIHIGTKPIEQIVQGLKELEDTYYKSLMQEADKASGESEVSLLKESSDRLFELQSSPVSLLSFTFSRRDVITVGNLAMEGALLKADMGAAGRAYETVMTVPRKDLGDSIQKAFQNVDDILGSLNLEASPANQRAVRILSYNNMELNYNNIIQMKEYDAKVNDMLSSMQPAVTAELIKRKVNPLNLTVDELREQAEAVKEDITVDEDEKYSEFLYRMDKQEDLSKEERSAYIGIYRLIHQVNKTDGAAIGSVVKAGRELTLSNLLTAVRTIKGTGIDKKIDDGFGYLEKINEKGSSITEQINSGIVTEDYGKLLLKKTEEHISPGKLHRIAEDSILTKMPIEQLSERLSEEAAIPEEDSRYQEKYEKMNNILTNGKKEADFLKNMGIEDNVSMIEVAKNLLESNIEIYDNIRKVLKGSNASIRIEQGMQISQTEQAEQTEKTSQAEQTGQASQTAQAAVGIDAADIDGILKSFSKEIIENLNNSETMDQIYKKYLDELNGCIETEKEAADINSAQLELLRSAGRSIKLIGALAEKEYYEIPIVTEQGITSMNVTIIHGQNEGQGIKISLKNTYGSLNVAVTAKNNEASINIIAENAKGLDEAEKNEALISEAVKKSGIQLNQINYSIKNSSKISYTKENLNGDAEKTMEATRTDELYSLARAMVKVYMDI